jgi:hypothetical protein
MLIYLIKAFGKFSYFSKHFSIFWKPKSIYLRYLKMFLETFIGFFLEFLEASAIF